MAAVKRPAILLAVAQEVPETYENLEVHFELLNLTEFAKVLNSNFIRLTFIDPFQ